MKINSENKIKSNEKTTILLSNETRNDLKNLGKKGESYDAIVRTLLEKWNEKN